MKSTRFIQNGLKVYVGTAMLTGVQHDQSNIIETKTSWNRVSNKYLETGWGNRFKSDETIYMWYIAKIRKHVLCCILDLNNCWIWKEFIKNPDCHERDDNLKHHPTNVDISGNENQN